MIFPDISIQEWKRKYPTLECVETRCIDCNAPVIAVKPYITKDYVGLVSNPCSCGSTRTGCQSSVTRTADEHLKWLSVMDSQGISE